MVEIYTQNYVWTTCEFDVDELQARLVLSKPYEFINFVDEDGNDCFVKVSEIIAIAEVNSDKEEIACP